MKTRDFVAESAPRLTDTLEPGEVLREVVPVSLTLGEDQLVESERADAWRQVREALEARVRPTGPPPGAAARWLGRLFGGVATLASGGSPFRWTGPEFANPNGKALLGFPGCAAQRLRDRIAGDGAERLLAATDRRVIVLDDPLGPFGLGKAERSGQPVPPLTVLDVVEPASLLSVARRPVGPTRARMEIIFTDGSMLAVTAGRAALADRFAAAVPPRPS